MAVVVVATMVVDDRGVERKEGVVEGSGKEGGGQRMLVTAVLRGVEGLAETEGRSRWRARRKGVGRGWLVGDALRELPAAGSRDSYPRPIIDRSLEKRRTDTLCPPSIVPCTLYNSFPTVGRSRVK